MSSHVVAMVASPLIRWNFSFITSGYWWPLSNNMSSFFSWNLNEGRGTIRFTSNLFLTGWWLGVSSDNIVVNMNMFRWLRLITWLLIGSGLLVSVSWCSTVFWLGNGVWASSDWRPLHESSISWVGSNNIIVSMNMFWWLRLVTWLLISCYLFIGVSWGTTIFWFGNGIWASSNRWPFFSKLDSRGTSKK